MELTREKEYGATHGQQHQTDLASRADAAVPNPLQTSTTDATHGQQHQTDFGSRADAAIPNPLHISTTAATHGQQQQTDFASRADTSVPNPLQTSTTGDTPIQQPQTDWRSIADAATTITNPMYNTRTGATHGQQHQTDFASRADAAANVHNPLHTSTTDRAIEMLRMMTSSKVCWVALGCGLLVIASVVTAAILASLLITKEKVTHNEGEPDIDDIVKVSASPSWWTTFYKDNSSAFSTSTVPHFSSTLFKDVNKCFERPCVHGGCVNNPGGFECTCSPGWTGQNCQQDVNECTTNPCQHGSCVNKDGGYDCNCHHGWTGTNCQQAIPCKSGWSEYNNHCYKLFKDKVDWFTANWRCKQHGANLASVGSAGENNFIASLITDGG
ncbi:hypothetical protein Bbelb_084350 [Branchiostoma belcheri]|nr:hypothetical protein Bbelb_084350 [Branchiostoma belcheri]